MTHRKAPHRWEAALAKVIVRLIVLGAVALIPVSIHCLVHVRDSPENQTFVQTLAAMLSIVYLAACGILACAVLIYFGMAVYDWIRWCLSTPPADTWSDALDASEGRD